MTTPSYHSKYLARFAQQRTNSLCKSVNGLVEGQAVQEYRLLRGINEMTDAELSRLIQQEAIASERPATQYDLIRQEWQMRLAMMSVVFSLRSRVMIIGAFVFGTTFGLAIGVAISTMNNNQKCFSSTHGSTGENIKLGAIHR
jgi:hypothetical protein